MNPFLHPTVASSRPRAASPATPARPVVPLVAPDRRTVLPLAPSTAPAPTARHWLARLCVGLALVAPGLAMAVDVNQAGVNDLLAVRGVGPKTAELIVREREKGGAFKSFEDFTGRVRGIGAKRAERLREAGLTVGAGAPAAAPVPAARGGARRP